MQVFPLIAVTIFALLGLAWGFVPCSDPSSSVGKWIGRDQECVALVQTNCHRAGGKSIGLTQTWKRDIHVKENCAKIPKFTAIATFLGPNGSYNAPGLRQHTAIFVKCEPNGIGVYDQWRGTPINYRTIRWVGNSPQYSGNNFYTIA